MKIIIIIIIVITPWIVIITTPTKTQKEIALVEVTVFICEEHYSLWEKELSKLSLYSKKDRFPSWIEMIWGRMKEKKNGRNCRCEMAWKFPTPSFIREKIIHPITIILQALWVFLRPFINIFSFHHKTLWRSLHYQKIVQSLSESLWLPSNGPPCFILTDGTATPTKSRNA